MSQEQIDPWKEMLEYATGKRPEELGIEPHHRGKRGGQQEAVQSKKQDKATLEKSSRRKPPIKQM